LPNGSEAVTYLDGDNVYVGLCRQVWSVPEDTKFSCPLPGKMYVYDVLKGKSLGVGDAVAGELAPGAAAVFACLPNQIADLAAEVKAGDGGVVDYTLKLSGERPGLAVKGLCRMDILRDGAVRYSRVLEADDKGRPGTWNFALNERSGKWLFRFTDLFAGKTVEKTVEAGR